MADQLVLKTARRRITERGYGSTQSPAEALPDLTGQFEIDPLTGYATPRVILSMADPIALDAVGDDWLESQPYLLPDGTYGDAWTYGGDGAWTLTTSVDMEPGWGFYLGFIIYTNGAGAGAGAIELRLPGGLTLALNGGVLTLTRNDDPLSSSVQLAEATIWEPEEWTAAGSSTAGIHYLYVYQVGDRLCARRLGNGGTGFQPTGRSDGPSRGLISTIDGHHEPLIGGPVRIAATGRLTVALAPERHDTAFWLARRPISLPEPSTGAAGLGYDLVKPEGVTVATDFLTAAGVPYGETPPTTAITGIGWRLDASGLQATGPTIHLTRVRLRLSEAVSSDGLTGTDLNTLTPAGIGGSGTLASVELRRGREPESTGLTARVVTQPGAVGGYLQPNMRGHYSPNSEQTLDFLTVRPTLRPGLNYDELTLDATTGHRRLKLAHWADAQSYGGRLLASAYRDVALKAGLDTAEIAVYTGGYEIPAEKPDGDPIMDFRPGQTNAEIIAYLREQFGPTDLHRWESDGLLHIRQQPETVSGVVFTWTTDAADLADIADRAEVTPRIGDDFTSTWDEDALVNDVWVVGRTRDGLPLCAVATDWPSVSDTDAPNYVAGFQRMTIIDGELQTQAMCNWVARSVLDRLCRPRYTCSFTSLAYEDLYEGELVELAAPDGISAGTIWRIIGYSRTDELAGSSRARYELEYVREGEAPE